MNINKWQRVTLKFYAMNRKMALKIVHNTDIESFFLNVFDEDDDDKGFSFFCLGWYLRSH